MSTAAPLQNAAAKPQQPVAGGLVLQRKCACGSGTSSLTGECEECRKKKQFGLQTKLRVSEPADAYEQEADRVAEQVMRMPEPANVSGARTPVTRSLVQRHVPKYSAGLPEAPPIVEEVLASPGKPLDAATRAFFEPRFGHDFSRVRVHVGLAAGESARNVSARAYTVGRNIVFGPGQYVPGSGTGRRLIAHELTHVVQQHGVAETPSAFRIAPVDDLAERWPESRAEQILAGNEKPLGATRVFTGLQRKISVTAPDYPFPDLGGKATNAQTVVQDYLNTLCPAGKVTIASGVVSVSSEFCESPWWQGWWPWPLTDSPAESTTTPTGCTCLCDLANSKSDWRITLANNVDWPQTAAVTKTREAGPGIHEKDIVGGEITIPRPNDLNTWGTATQAGDLLDVEPWLLLGHELCGHARLLETGQQAPEEGSRREEDEGTIEEENKLRREHGLPERGKLENVYCGESYRYRKGSEKQPSTVIWRPKEECEDM